MAQALAKRFVRHWPSENEDLESTAYVALVEAAQTFDPSRKVNFATFARHRIRGALREYRRFVFSLGRRGYRERPPFVVKVPYPAERHGRVLGAEPPPPVGYEIEGAEAVEKWLTRLPRVHAAACRLIYIQGKSQDEAAALLGYSKSYMSRLHRDAITWLIHEFRAAGGPGAAPALDDAPSVDRCRV
jgi:RNA polymerase sigma factor (sigma-70 family)